MGRVLADPVVRLISRCSPTRWSASLDIHFDPSRLLRIRYRIDGVLRQIRSLHRLWPQWLRISDGENEYRRDPAAAGRAVFRHHVGRVVDFRVASLRPARREPGAAHPDRQKGIVPLDKLGRRTRS